MKRNKEDFTWNDISVDKTGRTFSDENYFYRGIYNYKSQEIRIKKMFSSGLIDNLVKKELILPIEITDIEFNNVNEYSLVLKSEKIRNIIYPTEWSFTMLFDAAQLMIRLEKELLSYEYTLHDFHPYNIVFKGTQPFFCDIGSLFIRQSNSEKLFCQAMIEKYYRPLYVWRTQGKSSTNLYLFNDLGIEDAEWKKWIIGEVCIGKKEHLLEVFKMKKNVSIDTMSGWFGSLKDFSRSMEKGHWNWSDYQDEYFNNEGEIVLSDRFYKIINILKKYNIRNITELASNMGVLSEYCLKNDIVDYSLAVDYDEWAVDKMYNRLKGNGLSNRITTGVVDLVEPRCKDALKSRNRMKNECVLALAVIHHLTLSQGMTFDSVVDMLSDYSLRYVIVEFMPLGLYARHAGFSMSDIPKEYNLDNFIKAFTNKFDILEEEQIELNRILFVGEKKINNKK